MFLLVISILMTAMILNSAILVDTPINLVIRIICNLIWIILQIHIVRHQNGLGLFRRKEGRAVTGVWRGS